MTGAQTPFQNYATVAIIDPTSESGGLVNALKPNADGSLPVQVVEEPVVAADVLNGFTSSGTLLMIPEGTTWEGTIVISAALAAAAGASAVNAYALIATAGTGVTPAAGTQLAIALSTPAVAASTAGVAVADTVSMPLTVVAPSGNSVTLTFSESGMSQAFASASGTIT